MQVIRNDASLQQAIIELEQRKNGEAIALRDQWDYTRKNLNPLTILKDGVKDLFTSSDVKSGALKGILSLGAGFLTRKLFLGSSPGMIRKVVGTIAQTGATSLAFKSTDVLKDKGAPLLSKWLKKLKIGK
ncbi:MAG: hypothetical protein EOO50_02355 [Flavobacterium sp.]|uniref:hypothetical protein n=1 Tax=Flavobacterium sp. TaxID=239 RepID=UPI001208AA50|nr:hypothetical protein [Flavobacterium sp.]RZJ68282.1 MAG: hypothetical protein EOO50_02355 [Flavobacterium sp.]